MSLYDERERNEPDKYRKVVRVLDRIDYGPWQEDAHGEKSEATAECPHCGAWGRYVWVFETDDGQQHGAMEGCMQIWPNGKRMQAHWYKIQKRCKNVQDSAKDLLGQYDDEMQVLASVRDEFLRDVLEKGARYGFSIKQAAAVRRSLERDAAFAADRQRLADANVVVPTGDGITVEGTISSVKYDEDWDRWSMTIVGDDGWRVWGTIPADLRRSVALANGVGTRDEIMAALRGARVTVTANITASDRDQAFGIAKRPRKPAIIAPAA
jgi:hypothetical protein